MLYTLTDPAEPVDRVRLFLSLEEARNLSEHRGEHSVYAVAASFDRRGRCLVPLERHAAAIDPDWTTPVQPHGDGSITARGPIPPALYVRVLPENLSSYRGESSREKTESLRTSG